MVATRDNGSDPPTLLDMSNLVAIFGLIDVTQRGRYVLKEYDKDSKLALEFLNFSARVGVLRGSYFSPPL